MYSDQLKGFKSYLKLEKGLSANSISAYVRDLQKLIVFIEENYTDKKLEDLSPTILSEFVQDIAQKDVAPRSQARIISGVKAFYTYLILDDKVDNDPTEFIESPKIGQTLPVILSIEEVVALINSVDLSKAEGHRNKAIVETLYSCGLRVSELINLKISDLYFEDGFVRVRGKGGKERLVPIGQKAIRQLTFYMENYRNKLNIDTFSADIVFLNRRGKKITRVSIFNIVKDLALNMGLHKNISPHTFRHSFATHLVEGGADIRAVQEMLGHESIVTTEIYAHLDKDYLRSALIEFHPRS